MVKSPVAIRIQLTLPDDEQTSASRPSLDFTTIASVLSTSKPKIRTKLAKRSSSSFERMRTPRFSSLSSSYTQFLKERELDKNKKMVSKREAEGEKFLFDHQIFRFLVNSRRSSVVIIVQ